LLARDERPARVERKLVNLIVYISSFRVKKELRGFAFHLK